MNLLFVDNDKAMRELASEYFEGLFVKLAITDTAIIGWNMVKEYNGDFDIVITDIEMPGMDGLELLTKIKENFQHIKVFLITGNSNNYKAKAEELGAEEIISKPFSFSNLLDRIRLTFQPSPKG